MSVETAVLPQPTNQSERRESEAERRSKVSVALNSPLSGMLWFAGWLFTIGFAHLLWWKAALAVVVWPYFLGVTLR